MATSSPKQRTFKIFISYRKTDDLFCSLTTIAENAIKQCNEWLAQEMPNVRFDYFIDKNLQTGVDWRPRIKKELSTSDVLVPFITEDYCSSWECRYEFNLFMSKKTGNEYCMPVFWHPESTITSELAKRTELAKDTEKAQNAQDAQTIYEEASRKQGVSDVVSAVKELPKYVWNSPKSKNLQESIIISILEKLDDLAKTLESLTDQQAEDLRLSAQQAVEAENAKQKTEGDSTIPGPDDATQGFNDMDDDEPDASNDDDQSSPVFHFRTKRTGIDAQAQLIDGAFTVLQGSITSAGLNVKSDSKWRDSPWAKAAQLRYDRHFADGTLVTRDDGKTALVTRDIQFTSPSAAAIFALGHAPGVWQWQTDDGLSYKDWVKTMTEETGEETIGDEETEDAPKQAKKTAANKGRGRNAIAVGDDTTYGTITQVCNTVFGTNYVGAVRRTYFQPGTLHDRMVEGYEPYCVKAFFPRLTAEDGKPIMPVKDWSNELAHEGDGTYLYQTAADGTTKGTNKDEGTRDVVFGRFVDPETGKPYYRFLGVFANDGLAVRDGKASYRRKLVADSFPIIRD